MCLRGVLQRAEVKSAAADRPSYQHFSAMELQNPFMYRSILQREKTVASNCNAKTAETAPVELCRLPSGGTARPDGALRTALDGRLRRLGFGYASQAWTGVPRLHLLSTAQWARVPAPEGTDTRVQVRNAGGAGAEEVF